MTNVDEYGMTLRMQSDTNLQGSTVSITLKSPSPYIECKDRTEADGVMIGSVPIEVENGIIFPSNEYINYVIQPDDLGIPGVWLAKLYAQSATQERCSVSDWVPFTVEE